MKPSNVSSGRRLAALLSLTGVLLAGSSGYAIAGPNDSDHGQVLVGVWTIQVTPRGRPADQLARNLP
jgi:hypothetical protein